MTLTSEAHFNFYYLWDFNADINQFWNFNSRNFFWSRSTAAGAFSSVAVGLTVMAIFLFIDPETAFVPGFAASLLTFIIVSLKSGHSKEENLSIVRGWKRLSNDNMN